jgi:peroxiredoxin
MAELSRRSALLAWAATVLSPRLLRAAQVPRPAPEMVVVRTSGEQMRLSQYRGKIVVLEFLLTTCPHCQRCASVVQKVLPDYKAHGVEALGAAINDEARVDMLRFEMAAGSRFPIGIADRNKAYAFLEADPNAGPVYFPQLLLIDRKGVIRAQYPGGDKFFEQEEPNLRSMLDMLVKEPAVAQGAKK